MQYILALDQGTTSSRAIIFDHDGRIKAVAQKEFEQIFPKPGWVEHDPNEIWSSQSSVVTEALARANLGLADIAGIGITNQRETTILWDRNTGQPIHNAIVWQDRRTAGICDQLREAGHEELIQQKTGLVIDSYFCGTKIQWLLENVEGARAKAEAGDLAFGTVDSWLVWKLTNGIQHLTDVSNASRTLLYNIHTGEWDDELLDLFEVPAEILPEVAPSSQVYDTVAEDVFSRSIPIGGIAGDQQSALFGQLCTKRGMVKSSYGTGSFILMNTGTEAVPSENNLVTTVAWKIGDRTEYALEGSIFIAGAVVQWLRDGLKIIDSSSEIEGLAASVEDNGGVYMVPAFVGLGAPHWDQYARGTITGITRGTTDGHFARAALESIAYQVADVLEAMTADSGLDVPELRADGGASVNDLLLQFQADILKVPVVRPEVFETTALGAAFLAGLAVGYWESEEDIADHWTVDKRFEPGMETEKVHALRKGWSKALERARHWEEPGAQ
ncbi:MAG TPA: glycerol kinase GlpK [bacterium]|nr:glycerol kinase GlpK [bacterium]